jgi:HSP20 family protein
MVKALTPWSGSRPMMPSGLQGRRWFDELRNEMDDLFEQFLGAPDGGQEGALFAPRANVAETEREYEITLDLPGMKPEEVNVELKENQLWVSGERTHEAEEKGKTYHRIERAYGRFRRIIPLASQVKTDAIEAEYHDGVLRITVPKHEAAQPKRIEVKA